jgi:thiamine kinase-like enzyme
MHGDFRLDNLLFGVLQGKPNCWVIDWEDVTAWNGMFDVAWFLGGCLPVEKAGYEESLLRGYHQALTGGGVQDYSWETCCLDYRRAMASSFVQGILTIAALDQGSPYTHDLASVLTERFRSVCLRHRLYEIF